MSDEAEVRNLPIQLPEDKRAGVWANFALVSHSPYEFTIDFARLEFQGEEPLGGIVVQRVSVAPLFIQQLIEALQQNFDKWAEKAMPKEVTGYGSPSGLPDDHDAESREHHGDD